jgi:hypothetical protein
MATDSIHTRSTDFPKGSATSFLLLLAVGPFLLTATCRRDPLLQSTGHAVATRSCSLQIEQRNNPTPRIDASPHLIYLAPHYLLKHVLPVLLSSFIFASKDAKE